MKYKYKNMKNLKNFIFGICFVMLTSFGFISCMNHDVEPWTNEQQAQMIYDKYANAFIDNIGMPVVTQTWGFEQVALARATRAAYPNSNMWEDEGYVIPADITEAEIEKVLAVFNQKGEEHYESLVDWDCFFVQQVWKGTAEYKAGNGGTVVGGNQMDWLCAYDPIGYEETIEVWWPEYSKTTTINHDDHVNNFNNASGSIMLMVNSSTQRFGYKSSTDNGHVFYYFRMEEIDGAYYVGFDFSAEGQNSNEQVQRDLIYNDWIVKIVPGKGVSTSTEPKFICRVFAEDLSATTGTDFDFNDVVFDVYKELDGTSAKIEIMAAGGTLPLSVGGYEVHARFGENTGTMINTGDKADVNDLAAEPFTVENVFTGNDDLADVKDNIKVIVLKEGNIPCELTAQRGLPASKFAVTKKIDWANERQDIKTKYENFRSWVTNGTPEIWWE